MTGSLVSAVAAALPAAAGAQGDPYADFLAAFLHPLTSLDHGLALLAVGLLAGQRSPPATCSILIALLGGVLLGVCTGMYLPLPDSIGDAIAPINVASVLVLGALVALAPPFPLAVLLGIAAVTGMSHGVDNGLEISTRSASLAVLLGVGLAGALAALPAAVIIGRLPGGWPRIGVRVLGSWIAAIGLIVLGLDLRA